AAAPPHALMDRLRSGEGRAVISSSRETQLSLERPDRALGLFTSHLLDALQGAANRPGDTEVRLSNLINHLGRAVPDSARTLYEAEQTPFFATATEDFPVAVLRGGRGLPAGWAAEEAAGRERVRRVIQQISVTGDRNVIASRIVGSTIHIGDNF